MIYSSTSNVLISSSKHTDQDIDVRSIWDKPKCKSVFTGSEHAFDRMLIVYLYSHLKVFQDIFDVKLVSDSGWNE